MVNITTRKKIVFVCIAVVVLGALWWFVTTQNENKQDQEERMLAGETYEVVLEEKGFVPEKLSIARGDVVVFRSNRGYEHWPASNLHPTHNLYPAFDPKRPLAADETWAFQFTEVGTWEFHDHLNSPFTGVITVTE